MMTGIYEDLDAALAQIPGFLFSSAAHGTAWLLMEQAEGNLKGGILEIGVFRGKYFSVLAMATQSTGERLLGIDNFMFSPEEAVHTALAANPGTAKCDYRILPRSSRDVSGRRSCPHSGARRVSSVWMARTRQRMSIRIWS